LNLSLARVFQTYYVQWFDVCFRPRSLKKSCPTIKTNLEMIRILSTKTPIGFLMSSNIDKKTV